MSERRERVLAWAGSGVAVLYFAWLGGMLFHGTRSLAAMLEGLGAELPAVTRYAVDHRVWLLPAVFGVPTLIVVGKELLVQDKRLSLMLTMLLVIVVRFAVDVLITIYYLPLFDMIRKLSS